jgi:lipoprotein-anchoring transpeptidase ErfK/SrfK
MKKSVATVILAMGGLMTTTPASARAYIPADCQGFTGNIICASKGQNRVILVHNGQVVRSGKARFGGVASDGTGPWFTRNGVHAVGYKQFNPVSTLYGVNMPFFVQFSGGQGIHYSYEFAQTGYKYSHGCVGLRKYKFAQKVYNFAYPGMVVVVTSG